MRLTWPPLFGVGYLKDAISGVVVLLVARRGLTGAGVQRFIRAFPKKEILEEDF